MTQHLILRFYSFWKMYSCFLPSSTQKLHKSQASILNMCVCVCVCQKQINKKAGEAIYEAVTSSVTKAPCESSGVEALKPFDQWQRRESSLTPYSIFPEKNAWSCKASFRWPVSLLVSPYLLEVKFQATPQYHNSWFPNRLISEVSRILQAPSTPAAFCQSTGKYCTNLP